MGESDRQRLFQGYGPDGKPIPRTDLSEIQAGASGVYSTANDMVRWLRWHLDRGSPQGAEVRAIDHAAWVQRDGRNPVAGLDEGAHMSAMGLGWVILAPEGNRPLILQKTGGRQGILSTSRSPRGTSGCCQQQQADTGPLPCHGEPPDRGAGPR